MERNPTGQTRICVEPSGLQRPRCANMFGKRTASKEGLFYAGAQHGAYSGILFVNLWHKVNPNRPRFLFHHLLPKIRRCALAILFWLFGCRGLFFLRLPGSWQGPTRHRAPESDFRQNQRWTKPPGPGSCTPFHMYMALAHVFFFFF